ncbi:MAG: hypothetical protein AAB110_01360 [Candidatus Desantisbacteria bacterium]|mgnify:CR=1 FL=1
MPWNYPGLRYPTKNGPLDWFSPLGKSIMRAGIGKAFNAGIIGEIMFPPIVGETPEETMMVRNCY